MTSNAIPPAVTPPSPNEWPQNLIKAISGISRNAVAILTVANHGFTSQDQGQTFMTIKQVNGMIQINGLTVLLQQVLDVNNFTVNANTTNFYPYSSGGVIVVDSGSPPVQTAGFQTFNTPFENIAT